VKRPGKSLAGDRIQSGAEYSVVYFCQEMKMPAQAEFPIVFESLKTILKPYAKELTVKTDKPDLYYLDAAYSEKWKKELFFAAAQVKKNYVSFYLMPVYMYPDLLKKISPELKKHMQGKSCFN